MRNQKKKSTERILNILRQYIAGERSIIDLLRGISHNIIIDDHVNDKQFLHVLYVLCNSFLRVRPY